MNTKNSLYTIGHGNTGFEEKNLDQFLTLLNHYKIEALVGASLTWCSYFTFERFSKKYEKLTPLEKPDN